LTNYNNYFIILLVQHTAAHFPFRSFVYEVKNMSRLNTYLGIGEAVLAIILILGMLVLIIVSVIHSFMNPEPKKEPRPPTKHERFERFGSGTTVVLRRD